MPTNLDLDDILSEVREDTTLPRPKKKWTGGDIIFPIRKNNKIILCKIEDTTSDEFINWLTQVMPFTKDMMNVFTREGIHNIKEKINLFETVVILHARKWLFGFGGDSVNPEVKWS